MKKYIFNIIIVLFTVLPLSAWPGATGSTSGPGFNDDTQGLDTPVDGGIVTVTALAIGYSVRQARKRREDNNS